MHGGAIHSRYMAVYNANCLRTCHRRVACLHPRHAAHSLVVGLVQKLARPLTSPYVRRRARYSMLALMTTLATLLSSCPPPQNSGVGVVSCSLRPPAVLTRLPMTSICTASAFALKSIRVNTAPPLPPTPPTNPSDMSRLTLSPLLTSLSFIGYPALRAVSFIQTCSQPTGFLISRFSTRPRPRAHTHPHTHTYAAPAVVPCCFF